MHIKCEWFVCPIYENCKVRLQYDAMLVCAFVSSPKPLDGFQL